MEGYVIQPWLVWGILAVLFILGAWMRMGSYLLCLGLAALVALVEATSQLTLKWQIGSFVIASCLFVFLSWLFRGRPKPSQE